MTVMIDIMTLAAEIKIAATEVGVDSKGILSIGRRMRIYAAMIDTQDVERSYRLRISLQKKCVRHVQHLWTASFPNNPSLEDMLTLAHRVVERQVGSDRAAIEAHRFFQSLDRAATNPVNHRAIMVADAARQLIASTCYRNPYADIDGTIEDDDDLLPDSLDCSYACACAVAGGMNWRPADEVDVEARRAFWMWYLNEAIPSVLNN
ncbi:Imm5 family immunity protein [Actinomyces oris]|uniref:Imm5 family immunity protein n=1 Tax=Actinomyces oris TaxID=544580 RepID=UPI0028D5605D|nr:Imm5 family immunity protein [Actinomyces oris]